MARPLSEAIGRRGWTVWLDELALTARDSLSRHIDAVQELVSSPLRQMLRGPATAWERRAVAASP
jgi:hypothetical protein